MLQLRSELEGWLAERLKLTMKPGPTFSPVQAWFPAMKATLSEYDQGHAAW